MKWFACAWVNRMSDTYSDPLRFRNGAVTKPWGVVVPVLVTRYVPHVRVIAGLAAGEQWLKSSIGDAWFANLSPRTIVNDDKQRLLLSLRDVSSSQHMRDVRKR